MFAATRAGRIAIAAAPCLAALLLAGGASAASPGLTTLVQFNGTNGWTLVGNMAPVAGGIAAVSAGGSSVVLLSPPAAKGGAWTSTTLHGFGGNGDGKFPGAGVAVAGGQIYGSTASGGNLDPSCANGCGTVFALAPPATTGGTWTETQLIAFAADANGFGPSDTVLPAGSSTIYGTALHAANDTVHPGGTSPVGGVVFQLKKPASGTGKWTETVLHHFDAASSDGDTPYGGLIMGPGHVLYGTTFTGGACNQGTVYSLAPPAVKGGAWAETRLHDFGNTGGGFCNYDDGELPVAALTLVGNTLYGTTREGAAPGCGTAFSITLGSTPSYRLLYTFGQTAADSCSPQAPVRVDASGNIYGTTVSGGGAPASTECADGCGTLFELSPQAGGGYTNTVLYAFTGGTDGSEPRTNLLGALGKTLKGAASHGGFATDTMQADYASYGTLFQFQP